MVELQTITLSFFVRWTSNILVLGFLKPAFFFRLSGAGVWAVALFLLFFEFSAFTVVEPWVHPFARLIRLFAMHTSADSPSTQGCTAQMLFDLFCSAEPRAVWVGLVLRSMVAHVQLGNSQGRRDHVDVVLKLEQFWHVE